MKFQKILLFLLVFLNCHILGMRRFRPPKPSTIRKTRPPSRTLPTGRPSSKTTVTPREQPRSAKRPVRPVDTPAQSPTRGPAPQKPKRTPKRTWPGAIARKKAREAKLKEQQRKKQLEVIDRQKKANVRFKELQKVRKSRQEARQSLIRKEAKRIKDREIQFRLIRPTQVIPVERPVVIQQPEEFPPDEEEGEIEIGIPEPAEPIPSVQDMPEPEEEILPTKPTPPFDDIIVEPIDLPEPKPPLVKTPSTIIREEEIRLFESLAEFDRESLWNDYDIQLIGLLQQQGKAILNFLKKPNSQLITLKMPSEWAFNLGPVKNMIDSFNYAAQIATKPEHIEKVKQIWLDTLKRDSKRLGVPIGFQ